MRVAERPRGEHLAADLAGGRHRLPLVHRPHVDPEGGRSREVLAALQNEAISMKHGPRALPSHKGCAIPRNQSG